MSIKIPAPTTTQQGLKNQQLENFLKYVGKTSQSPDEIKEDEFVELHLHTEHSALDGATRIEEIVPVLKEHKQTAIAVTDHGTMSSIYDLYKECKKAEIKLIPGIEAYIVDDVSKPIVRKSRKKKKVEEEEEEEETTKPTDQEIPPEEEEEVKREQTLTSPDWESHIVLLPKNEVGYKNLLRIHFKGYQNKRVNTFGRVIPRIDLSILEQHKEGVIALTACFTPETRVYTKHLSKEIKEVDVGDFVVNSRGEWTPVKRVTLREVDTTLYNFNRGEFWATEEHQFLSCQWEQFSFSKQKKYGGEKKKLVLLTTPQWRSARDLKKGDCLLHSRPRLRESVTHLSVANERQTHPNTKVLPSQIECTPQLMYVLGWYAAEGSVYNGRVTFTLHKKEISYAQEILSIHQNIFGVDGKIVPHITSENCIEVHFCSSNLEDFYTTYVGKGALTKQFSPELMEAKNFKYLIKGYFLGDGSISDFSDNTPTLNLNGDLTYKTCAFTYATSSYIMADQLFLKLMEIGYRGTRWSQIPKTSKKMNRSYYWSVSGDAARRIQAFLVSFDAPLEVIIDDFGHGAQRVGKLVSIHGKQYYLSKIAEIETKNYKGPVHCLTVDGEDPSFNLKDTTVHNCLGGMLNQALIRGAPELAEQILLKYKNTFEHLFIELQPIGIISQNDRYNYRSLNTIQTESLQALMNRKLVELAYKHDVKIVVTTDAHYARKEDRETHALLLATQSKKDIADPKCFFFPALPMMTSKELAEQFPIEWIKNTKMIADMCEESKYLDFGKNYKIPQFPIPLEDTDYIAWKNALPQ